MIACPASGSSMIKPTDRQNIAADKHFFSRKPYLLARILASIRTVGIFKTDG
jgi:hypothetical protein